MVTAAIKTFTQIKMFHLCGRYLTQVVWLPQIGFSHNQLLIERSPERSDLSRYEIWHKCLSVEPLPRFVAHKTLKRHQSIRIEYTKYQLHSRKKQRKLREIFFSLRKALTTMPNDLFKSQWSANKYCAIEHMETIAVGVIPCIEHCVSRLFKAFCALF